jgi:hypothetical protein
MLRTAGLAISTLTYIGKVNRTTPAVTFASVQMAAVALENMHAAILHSREESTMIPTPFPVAEDSTQDSKQADERCLMAELSIIRAGRHYFYDGHRYERLADAVEFAQVVQGRARRARPPATQ